MKTIEILSTHAQLAAGKTHIDCRVVEAVAEGVERQGEHYRVTVDGVCGTIGEALTPCSARLIALGVIEVGDTVRTEAEGKQQLSDALDGLHGPVIVALDGARRGLEAEITSAAQAAMDTIMSVSALGQATAVERHDRIQVATRVEQPLHDLAMRIDAVDIAGTPLAGYRDRLKSELLTAARTEAGMVARVGESACKALRG